MYKPAIVSLSVTQILIYGGANHPVKHFTLDLPSRRLNESDTIPAYLFNPKTGHTVEAGVWKAGIVRDQVVWNDVWYTLWTNGRSTSA
jgi:hypothetical protein